MSHPTSRSFQPFAGSIMTIFATIPTSLMRFILGQLYSALPPVPGQDPDTLEARNQVALAAIARLTPMNTAEALLAVHAIACEAHASSALREAVLHHQDIRLVGQARAQSALMIREAMQVRKELRVMQEERRSAEHAHQQRIEAEEREAEEALRRADETAPAPFMRRLAQRQRDENQPKMSHDKGINTNTKSMRLNQGSKGVPAHAVILDRSSGPNPRERSWAVVP